jgi:hypothetical protein
MPWILSMFFGLNVLLKVPPPMKFSRPSGGTRSVVFQMEPAAKNRVQNNRPSSSPQPSPSPEPFEPPMPHPRQHLRQRGKTHQKYSKPIFGEGAEEEFRSNTRPRRVVYQQSTLRGFSTTRAAQLVNSFYIDNLATHNVQHFRLLSENR